MRGRAAQEPLSAPDRRFLLWGLTVLATSGGAAQAASAPPPPGVAVSGQTVRGIYAHAIRKQILPDTVNQQCKEIETEYFIYKSPNKVAVYDVDRSCNVKSAPATEISNDKIPYPL